MLIVGLILFCAAAAAIAGVIVAGGSPAALQYFDTNVFRTTNTSVYILGAITGVVLAIGLSLLLAGWGRGLRRRRTRRAEARERALREESLRDHNARLQTELARARGATRGAPPAPDGSTGDEDLDTVIAKREQMRHDDAGTPGTPAPASEDIDLRDREHAHAGGGRHWLRRDRHDVEPD